MKIGSVPVGLAAMVILGVGFVIESLPGQKASAASANKALIDDLVIANQILAHEIGVLDAYGHVSVRDNRNPSHYYLSRAISAGMVTTSTAVR